ncbi:hypothetical protein CDCA_CDCA07G2069 [Cyanidium caldarium]|uniref:NHL repeat containing protein n=1 Tax=Cyanidium caldarium TaxID=2771 RepID=A0AAV9IV77_CYACA|nr:hypothetical protein CDCA_CDCA07G2069 [Cyanidium caldarium]
MESADEDRDADALPGGTRRDRPGSDDDDDDDDDDADQHDTERNSYYLNAQRQAAAASTSAAARAAGAPPTAGSSSSSSPSDPISVSRREILYAMVGVLGLTVGSIAWQRWSAIRRWSVAALMGGLQRQHPPRETSALRDFFIQCEAGSGPVAPALQNCHFLQWLGGAATAEAAAPGHCADRKLLVMHFWRSTDVHTGQALDLLEAARPWGDCADTVCIHAPKYDGEYVGKYVQQSAKYHEMNFPYAADVSLHLWRALGVVHWPTTVVLSPRSKRVLFAFCGRDEMRRLPECLQAAARFYFPKMFEANAATATTTTTTTARDRAAPLPVRRLRAQRNAFAINAAAVEEMTERRRRTLEQVQQYEMEKPRKRGGGSRVSPSTSAKRDATSGSATQRSAAVAEAEALGRELAARLRSAKAALTLRFPGDVVAHAESDRLFIADSGHHRVLVTTLAGEFVEQIGGRDGAGYVDGPFEQARFQYPQGLAFDPNNNRLVVADGGNEAIRIVNLVDRRVTTVPVAPPLTPGEEAAATVSPPDAGPLPYKGPEMAATLPPSAKTAGDAPKRESSLPPATAPTAVTEAKTSSSSSPPLSRLQAPCHVTLHAGSAYVAAAGSHQIWRLDPSGILREFCGSGRAGHVDDTDGRPNVVSFAAPRGICSAGASLYVADTDSSTLREVNLRQSVTRTVVGGDPLFLDNLSCYGDRDGLGSTARFQFPSACCSMRDGRVLVTDTLNHKIKVVNPAENEVYTLAGSGEYGLKDGTGQHACFWAPQGITYNSVVKVAYVADTYNHCIRQVDVVSGTVRTLPIVGPAVLEAVSAWATGAEGEGKVGAATNGAGTRAPAASSATTVR